MNLKFLLFLVIGIYPIISSAEDSTLFSNLKKIEIKPPHAPYIVDINYNSKISTVINKDITDPESEIYTINVVDTYLDDAKTKKVNIVFSDGASADPCFIITSPNFEKKIIGGIHLYIPGDGSIYVNGHTDNDFDEHRKFLVTAGKLTEVNQPFLYVGLESKALHDIEIYSDKTLLSPVAIIPKGEKLTVLVNDNKHYLIKNNYGLLGWFQPNSIEQKAADIEGLFYIGD